MRVSTAEAEQFYAAWYPLLAWVNEERKVLPAFPPAPPYEPRDLVALRDVLWADDALRHRFVRENPRGLAPAQRALIASWDHRRAGTFTVWRHYKKHTVFLDDDGDGYAVLGLETPLAEVLPMVLPAYVQGVLLPIGERISYDGLLLSYPVLLGPGLRRLAKQRYDDVLERRALRYRLLPETPEEQAARAERDRLAVNKTVLQEFAAALHRQRRSVQLVARDVHLAQLLGAAIAPCSLRECSRADVEAGIARMPPQLEGRRVVLLALTRFFRFLQQTERMGYWNAQDVLDGLAGRA